PSAIHQRPCSQTKRYAPPEPASSPSSERFALPPKLKAFPVQHCDFLRMAIEYSFSCHVQQFVPSVSHTRCPLCGLEIELQEPSGVKNEAEVFSRDNPLEIKVP